LKLVLNIAINQFYDKINLYKIKFILRIRKEGKEREGTREASFQHQFLDENSNYRQIINFNIMHRLHKPHP